MVTGMIVYLKLTWYVLKILAVVTKKGCPGLYKVLSSGKLAFQNECC